MVLGVELILGYPTGPLSRYVAEDNHNNVTSVTCSPVFFLRLVFQWRSPLSCSARGRRTTSVSLLCVFTRKKIRTLKFLTFQFMDTFYLTQDKFRTKLSITSLKQSWRKFTLTKQVVACNSNCENDCFTQSPSRFYRHTDEKIRHILWTRYVS